MHRYHAVLFPVTSFVCEVLPEGQRESSRTELFYEDLDRLPPDEVARICEWITEKVDGFSAKLKPEAKDAELEVRLCILCRCSRSSMHMSGLQHVDMNWQLTDKAELQLCSSHGFA